jgi:hypothetical protein
MRQPQRVPDGVVPLVGYREWSIRTDAHGRPRLVSLFHPTVWPPNAPFSAICLRPVTWPHRSSRPTHGGVPDGSCQCGIYAFRRPEFESLNGAADPKVRGIVLGWGRYVLGSIGWRSQFARMEALLAPDEGRDLVDDVAERYAVAVIPHLERIRFLVGHPAA